MDTSALLAPLDDDQRAVVETLGAPVAVLAGAGTGKTRTLTHRLAYAARCGDIDPGATLALTFTTAAADEVRTRLEAMGVRSVQSRTFHSACLRQAQFFWPEVYGCALPMVQDRREPLIRQACSRLGLTPTDATIREIDAEISWTKQTNVLPEEYVDLARADRRGLVHLGFDQVADAIVAYEEAKQIACVIDLDDLLLCTVALLATRSEVVRRVHATYRHFLFDEFQDVSPVQARLVELWVGGRGDVCVVGDPAQTIHSFAGSRSVYLERFADNHPGAAELQLTRNYRSTPQILRAAARLNTTGGRLQAVRPSGAEVEWRPATDPLAEVTAIAEWLRECHGAGLAWEQMAVLARTRAQAESMRQILADQSVPFAWQRRDDRAPGVRLSTLHAAKGLEWEAVAISGLSDGSLPHPLAVTPAQVAEERRLLYVGMTRARSFLRLSWPRLVDGRPVRVTPFLDPP